MNKKTVAVTPEEFREVIELVRDGFMLGECRIRPNERIATLLCIQGNLGLRLSDILNLKMNSFIYDSGRYRLDIVEQKTKKVREFTVNSELFNYIQAYAYRNDINPEVKLFDISARQVEKVLAKAFERMGLPLDKYSTHSLRKYYACEIYKNSDYNIELVRILLQHSSVTTTQRYLTISPKEVEDAIARHLCLV